MCKVLFVIAICFMLVGCNGNTPSVPTQDAVIKIVAQDVGYIAYRAVPDARIPLAVLCTIDDFSNPSLVAARIKDLLGTVWKDASKLTDQDAQIAVLTINNLIGLLDAQLANENTERAVAILRLVIENVCFGVNLA